MKVYLIIVHDLWIILLKDVSLCLTLRQLVAAKLVHVPLLLHHSQLLLGSLDASDGRICRFYFLAKDYLLHT